MTARRQSSTTSLSKYARTTSPDLSNRSLDFCNAFWGARDEGVEVLFARMRGAARTVDELRAFWKERASIEEDYAKRMAKLAKQTLGKDEIGELRNSLDSLRLETDRQASSHSTLAQQLRTELENPATAFTTKQTSFKRIYQSAIEKQFKTKQTQESYVAKAREKYESDCMRINSYTAQSSLVQGKDLDKINAKLDRAKQTVTANERDFANFARALQETVQKWEKDWKSFSDGCQDLEEERIEFMKDNVWAYANAVSTVCVSDDESCEKIRLALEQLEPERDMENFVRDYGTGNEVSEPPRFFSYTNPESSSSSSSRQATKYAHFPRASQRQFPPPPARPPPEEEPLDAGNAGIGAGDRPTSVSYSRPASAAANHDVHTTAAPSSASIRTSTVVDNPSPVKSETQGIHKTMLQVGENAYEVEPEKDPQLSRPATATSPAPSGSKVGGGDDPLAKQMANLQMSAAGSVRRSSTSVTRPSATPVPAPAASTSPPPRSAAGLHSPSNSQQINLHNSADMIVGGYPTSPSRSHSPANPQAPAAVFMQPNNQKPADNTLPVVDNVLASYSQSFPGERRSLSRSNSPAAGLTENRNSIVDRPKSREGHAGIGAHGRTPSPQPIRPTSVAQQRPPSTSNVVRPTSSASVGISLDPTGRVAHDDLALRYQEQQQQQQQQMYNQQPQQPHFPPQRNPSVQMPSNIPRQQSYQPPAAPYQAPSPQAPYSHAPPAQVNPPPMHPTTLYNPHTSQPPYQQQQMYQQPPPPPQMQQPAYTPAQPNGANRMSVPGYQPVNNINGGHHEPDPGYGSNGFHPPPNNVRRSPSPGPGVNGSPTGAYTDDGKPILFYVKAMYDYKATIDEEFDFTNGDVIAVTSTPEDGWWTGMLLDDTRRVPGRTVFPSNFVCLF
ncbi:hypothetical protein SCHPADRAFT_922307 [Schizopora paradoxa]|uniref:SH3 domain-containing protein n=1 Tax=Schizopora paradoxa TaxID=27342 RepID=A0A0H2RDS6_9AGAM|nr:hypothetical protein SCHPADRAFT_922307 [Schizopora paradoxa]